ncbi:MAG: carbohydrate kinase family protein [Chloroflexi bacterium]|nr:carbohydrate kinase family protein [Chloroflexota bacterium]
MTVVVTGSIAYDYIMSFPGRFRDHILPENIDHLSLSFLVDSLTRQRGGCAPNIAYSLSLLGVRPRIMAAAGQDFEDYRRWLEQHNIDLSWLRVYPDEYTASFFVSTDEENNQIASFYTGAMARSRELSFYDVDLSDVDLVVISPNDPEAMRRYVRECQALNLPFIYDPSQQIVRLSAEDLLEGIDAAHLVICNDYEYELIKHKTGLTDEELLRRAGTLVVTQGEKGSTIHTQGRSIPIPPAPPRRIADPTGVGDAYRGGLIAGMLRHFPWEVAGRLGSLAATYALEHAGPQEHFYTREEFVQRYRETFGDTPELEVLLRDADA